jgi:hypothetical protein
MSGDRLKEVVLSWLASEERTIDFHIAKVGLGFLGSSHDDQELILHLTVDASLLRPRNDVL